MILSDHGSFIGFPLSLYVLYKPNQPDLDVFKTYLQEHWDYLVNLQIIKLTLLLFKRL